MRRYAPKRPTTWILETAAAFAFAVFLIRLAIHWLTQIKWPLLILAGMVTVGTIAYRILKHRRL